MGITCEIVGELCGIVRVLRPIWPALADPLLGQVVMIRIGYSLVDRLITYPRASPRPPRWCRQSLCAGEDGPRRQFAQSADHLGHNGCILVV